MDSKRLILVVEDTEEDIELLKLAIRKAGVQNPIQVVKDGQEAIGYLRGEGKFKDRRTYPFPGVIFLDLKLPKMTGFEVLRYIKEHEECRVIPIMVLTSSSLDEDVLKAYRLSANSYMVKPGNLGELIKLVDLCFRYWSTTLVPKVSENVFKEGEAASG